MVYCCLGGTISSPKNWRRQKSEEQRIDHVEFQWINEALPVHRVVRVEKFPHTKYRISYSKASDNPIAIAKTKDEARKKAVKWMREHPAPDVPKSVAEEALE